MHWPLVKHEVMQSYCYNWKSQMRNKKFLFFLTNRNPYSQTPKVAFLGMWLRSKGRLFKVRLALLFGSSVVRLSICVSHQRIPGQVPAALWEFLSSIARSPWSSSQNCTVGKNGSGDSCPSHLDTHAQWICII